MWRPTVIPQALRVLRAIESIGDPDLLLFERRVHDELARFDAAEEPLVAALHLLQVLEMLEDALHEEFPGHPALRALSAGPVPGEPGILLN